MIDIIEERRRPSTSDKFAGAFSKAFEVIPQYMMQKEQEKSQMAQMKQENDQFKNLTGLDISGIQDPKMREQAFKYAMEGQQGEKKFSNEQELQRQKYGLEREGKESLFDKKQDYLSKLFGGNQQQEMGQPNQQSQQQSGFNPSNISDEDIARATAIDPNLGRSLSQAKDVALRENREKRKEEIDLKKGKQHEREFFHTESKDYDKGLTEQFTAAEKKNRALEEQVKRADKLGKWDRVVSALAGQSKWGNLLKSKNAQEFDSYALPQMEGLRQILGGVLSDSDIRLIMQKVVTSDKTPEANKSIAKYLMSENNYVISKKQIADELKRNNGGYRPANYDSEINRVFNERYGNQIKKEFEELQSLPDDPKKLSQVGRRVVPPGTPLGENSIKMYFELANGDPMKATELAEEDGYDVPK